MAEDKDKIVETPEIPEVMEEEVVEEIPETTEEEVFVETEEESLVTPVEEAVETPTVEDGEEPVSEVKDDIISEKEDIEEPQFSSYSYYADEPFLADNRVKSEIRPKWNWGAMAMPIFFGVANRSYLGLLGLFAFIPWLGWIFAIVWAIVFGINGERWALQNPDNRYRDEEEFRKIMDGWNRAGLVAFIIGVVGFVILLLFFMILGAAIFNNMEQFPY